MNSARKRPLGRLAMMAVLSLAALLAILAWLSGRSGTQDRIARLRTAGYPLTAEELDAWYAHPPFHENLSPPLLEAMGMFRFNRDDTNLPALGRFREEPGRPWPRHVLNAAQGCLATNASALVRLHAALGRPGSRYPVNLAKGYMATLAPLSTIKDAGRALALEACVAAEENRPEDAVRALLLAQHLGDTLEAEPILISYLVAVSIRGVNLKATETVLSRGGLSPSSLRQLQERFLASAAATTPERAMAGEMANFLEWTGRRTASLRDLGLLGSNQEVRLAVYWALGLRHRDRRVAIQHFDGLLTAIRLPADQRNTALRNREAQLSQTLSSGRYPLAAMMLSSGTRTADNHATDLTRLRAAATACAIERFRQHRGNLPESLEALVPEFMTSVPTDAFSGRPLSYRRLDRGFVVFGLGEDGVDNGGLPREQRPKQGDRNLDDTFTVSR